MNEYFKKMINQFKSSEGLKNIDINSERFLKEFYEWLDYRNKIREDYSLFFDYIINDGNNQKLIEVGKGKFDSILLNRKAIMITPYIEELKNISKSKIIKGNLIVNKTPIIIDENNQKRDLSFYGIEENIRFITQNPYSEKDIDNWDQLQNNITLGVYGSVYDKDINEKLKYLEYLESKLYSSYRKEHTIIGDTYCCAITSNDKKVLKK